MWGEKKRSFLSQPLHSVCHVTQLKINYETELAAFSLEKFSALGGLSPALPNRTPAPGGGAPPGTLSQSTGQGLGLRAVPCGKRVVNLPAQGLRASLLLCGLEESLGISEPQFPQFNQIDHSPHASHQLTPLCLALLNPYKPL